MTEHGLSRNELRQHLRQRRARLSPVQQLRAATSLYRHVIRDPLFQQARRIAFYLPANHELDPRPVLSHALRSGKRCYLPVLSPIHAGRMHFVRVQPGQSLKANRWGILEPPLKLSRTIQPWALDLVFMPLLGVDRKGNRLGMGKGFYDRAFEVRRRLGASWQARRHRPVLAGLAHPCQLVERITAREHDVPVDVVLTPQGRL